MLFSQADFKKVMKQLHNNNLSLLRAAIYEVHVKAQKCTFGVH